MSRRVKTARARFKKDTKRAVRRSFHPREMIIPSEKLEEMTAKSIYSGIQLWKAKRQVKRKRK